MIGDPIRVAVTLRHLPDNQLAADGEISLYRDRSQTQTLVPRSGPTHIYYRVHVFPEPWENPWPGWLALRIGLQIDGRQMGEGAPYSPLTLYVGEATDDPTGLVRFPASPHDPPPVGVWLLGVRRST